MKIPKAKRLPSGSWNIGLMVDGHRMSITAPTEKECVAKAAAVKAGLEEAKDRERSGAITVGEAIDRYIESKDAVLSPATVAGYRRIRVNALQELMGVGVRSVDQQMVQRAVNAMSRSKGPKTVRNAHGLLAAALAVYRPDLTLRTVMPQRVRYDAAIPSREDVTAIMGACRRTEDELPILLAIWLGLRMSEVLGLRWEDIDMERGIVHIRHALVDEGEKGTKTYSSQRDLPLPAYIRDLLEAAPRRGDHVVPLTRRALYARFQRVCREAGVQHYRFHDLRHINASVMLALGVPDRYARERMGHATDTMLKTVYQHTMRAETMRVAEAVDGFFEGLEFEITDGITHDESGLIAR